jgi:hypothetical protein
MNPLFVVALIGGFAAVAAALINVLGAKQPAPLPPIDVVQIGACKFDRDGSESLKRVGMYTYVASQCQRGKAETVGPTFRFPELHPSDQFQYWSPGKFYNAHRDTINKGGLISAVNGIESKIQKCFQDSFSKGSSPNERIELEIGCLEGVGLSIQDKTLYMLVENAKKEGFNDFS